MNKSTMWGLVEGEEEKINYILNVSVGDKMKYTYLLFIPFQMYSKETFEYEYKGI